MKRVHLVISGRVQGVGFRSGAVSKARELGLVGWVKNLDDGRVEVVAEGGKEGLEGLVAWCRHGPVLARVDNCLVSWEKARPVLSSCGKMETVGNEG